MSVSDNAPYDRRQGRSVQERNSQRSEAAFRQDPVGGRIVKLEGQIGKTQGDVAGLRADVVALQSFNSGMVGNDGIKIDRNMFSLDLKSQSNQINGGGSSPTKAQKFFGVRNGAFVAWEIAATDTAV